MIRNLRPFLLILLLATMLGACAPIVNSTGPDHVTLRSDAASYDEAESLAVADEQCRRHGKKAVFDQITDGPPLGCSLATGFGWCNLHYRCVEPD